MDYNDFDWDQKIINDIFMDINVELNKPLYKPVYNPIYVSDPIDVVPKESNKKETTQKENTKENIQNENMQNDTLDTQNDTLDTQNEVIYNKFPDDEIMGFKFPYSKKFYIILSFILFLICIYMYNMISKYDTMLLLILQNRI